MKIDAYKLIDELDARISYEEEVLESRGVMKLYWRGVADGLQQALDIVSNAVSQ